MIGETTSAILDRDFREMYARARVMGCYLKSENAYHCVTEMPSNAVAVLLLSGHDQPSF